MKKLICITHGPANLMGMAEQKTFETFEDAISYLQEEQGQEAEEIAWYSKEERLEGIAACLDRYSHTTMSVKDYPGIVPAAALPPPLFNWDAVSGLNDRINAAAAAVEVFKKCKDGGEHQPIDIGVLHSKMICKKCDKDL